MLARVRATVGQLPTLVSTRAVPVFPGDAEHPGSDPLQLPRVLREVCGDRLRAQVWTTLDSPATLTQIIRVPQVQDSLLPNVALWTLHKGKNVEIEGSVLDFEVLRTVEQDGARQLELFTVAAPRTEVDEVVAEFRAIDYPLTGVVPSVLAFRNLLRFAWPEACRGQCILVCVNDEDTEVLLVSEGKPLGTRSVRTGMSSLRHAFAQHLDVDVMDARVEECMGALRGGPLPADVPGSDPIQSADDVLGWVRPAARRLVRNVQRALHGFEVEHGVGDGAVFLVTGQINAYPLVGRFLGTQLGVQMHGLTDPARAFGLRAADAAPPAAEEGSGPAVAIGLALAAAYNTGNFLFTFENRLAEQRRRRLRHVCLGLAVTVLLALLGVVAFLQTRVIRLQRECERLQSSRAASSSPRTEGVDVAALMARVGAAQTRARKLAEVYFAPALIAELASLTAPPVHLLALELDFVGNRDSTSANVPLEGALARTAAGRRVEARQATGTAGQGSGGGSGGAPRLLIQGVLAGSHDRVDAELAAYVLRLCQSPLLANPVVTESRVEPVEADYLAFEPRDADRVLFFSVAVTCRQGVGSTASGAPALPPPRPAVPSPSPEEGGP